MKNALQLRSRERSASDGGKREGERMKRRKKGYRK
jgi:hypothetical protein